MNNVFYFTKIFKKFNYLALKQFFVKLINQDQFMLEQTIKKT